MAFFPSGPFSPLVLVVTAILVSNHISSGYGTRYKASVFEFKPFAPRQGSHLSRDKALDLMRKNIAIYKMQARIAAEKRGEIIVFPEYGLFGIFGYAKYARRSDIYPFLETIPDPKRVASNPCKDRRQRNDTVQYELSCMATHFDIYVVANVGEKVACRKSDPRCPEDGRYQYNTNVVYSSNGTLIAKYRKKHLFKEPYYDSPIKTEVVTFTTHFGKFGLLTSHDSLFDSPILDLVKQKVRDIVMPTAWMTTTPLFRAIQWHSSFARGLELNLIVATIHDGYSDSYGSGIYGRDGAKGYFSEPDNLQGKLVSEDLRHISFMQPRKLRPVIPRGGMSQTRLESRPMNFLDTTVKFKFYELTKSRDDINICDGRFCCRLSYSVEMGGRIEKYALAVYKGPVRSLGYSMAVEVCAVVRCSPTCGQPIQRANTYFENFRLIGVNFSTPYVFPQVLTLSGSEAVLPTHQWDYEHGEIVFDKAPENPLHSASLIGRVYNKDRVDHRRPSSQGTSTHLYGNYAHAQYTSCLILFVAFIASINVAS